MIKIKKALLAGGVGAVTFFGAHVVNNHLLKNKCEAIATGSYIGKGLCLVENQIVNMNNNTVVNEGDRKWIPPEKSSE